MKRIALLAAAALAALATPAFAGGQVGIDYGRTSTDAGDLNTLQVEGAWGGVGANWGAQVDGAYGNVDADGSDVDVWTLAGHLYWRTDNFRLGVVALTTQLTDDTADADETSYGVEGS